MVEWYCVRCSKKLGIETDEEPAPIRVCDGCGVENYCRPVKSSPDIIGITREGEVLELEGSPPEELVVEAEEVPKEDFTPSDSIAETKPEVETILTPPTEDPEAGPEETVEEVKINVTMDTDEAIASLTELEKQIAELEARKAELEAKE